MFYPVTLNIDRKHWQDNVGEGNEEKMLTVCVCNSSKGIKQSDGTEEPKVLFLNCQHCFTDGMTLI